MVKYSAGTWYYFVEGGDQNLHSCAFNVNVETSKPRLLTLSYAQWEDNTYKTIIRKYNIFCEESCQKQDTYKG